MNETVLNAESKCRIFQKDAVAARAGAPIVNDAAEGGRFILSTGDQCGRDTPDENLFAMIETARTYGKYEKT